MKPEVANCSTHPWWNKIKKTKIRKFQPLIVHVMDN